MCLNHTKKLFLLINVERVIIRLSKNEMYYSIVRRSFNK